MNISKGNLNCQKKKKNWPVTTCPFRSTLDWYHNKTWNWLGIAPLQTDVHSDGHLFCSKQEEDKKKVQSEI